MKVDDIFENYSLELLNAEAELDMEKDLTRAYDEILKIHNAINKKDFGIIIDKKGKKLDFNDIQKIKRELKMIFRNNQFFQRQIRNPDDFQIAIRRAAHKVEIAVLSVFSGIFALSSVVTGPVGLALAAGFGVLAGRSARMANAIKTSAGVLNVAHAFGELNKVEPGRKKRIEDLIKKKDPKELERLIKNDAKNAGDKFQKKFAQALKQMPSHIVYYDKDGEKQLYPIEQIFE